MQKIVITDLDGTLLHSRTYSFEPAHPALALLKERKIPLVLCSSKTRLEMEVYRSRLDNHEPFIVENGGGIVIPQKYFFFENELVLRDGYRRIDLGTPHTVIRRHFISLRRELASAVRGFSDMTLEEVSSLTGLGPEEAALAVQREYDEPFVFSERPDPHFLRSIEKVGLNWTEASFYHLMQNHDKGKAVTLLKRLLERKYGSVFLVGLGDSLNDLAFLRVVDKPVLVRKEDGRYETRIDLPGLYRTGKPGPEGWNEAVLHLVMHE